MQFVHWAGALALAVGLSVLFLGIGFVARDEVMGWVGIAGAPPPIGLGVWLMRKPGVS
jgi:hypothetical protein